MIFTIVIVAKANTIVCLSDAKAKTQIPRLRNLDNMTMSDVQWRMNEQVGCFPNDLFGGFMGTRSVCTRSCTFASSSVLSLSSGAICNLHVNTYSFSFRSLSFLPGALAVRYMIQSSY